MGKTCVICNKPSGMYPLCKEHLQMKLSGDVIKCPECGTWHLTKIKCPKCDSDDKIQTTSNSKISEEDTIGSRCLICGEDSKGKPQCLKCYRETRSYIESFDKNSTIREFRDYYYNLKDSIYRMSSLEVAQTNCNKLIAIAMINDQINDDSSLITKVFGDVKKLIDLKTTKHPEISQDQKQDAIEKDESKTKIFTSQDGHNVHSDMEIRIDDMLYQSYILHCYEKSIDEFLTERKKCDWFIPICNGKGIYVEYWGMDTPKYLKDREEKEKLYIKYGVPYIGIEKDDPKKDTQTFMSNFIKELKQKAIEAFGFMPEWKK